MFAKHPQDHTGEKFLRWELPSARTLQPNGFAEYIQPHVSLVSSRTFRTSYISRQKPLIIMRSKGKQNICNRGDDGHSSVSKSNRTQCTFNSVSETDITEEIEVAIYAGMVRRNKEMLLRIFPLDSLNGRDCASRD